MGIPVYKPYVEAKKEVCKIVLGKFEVFSIPMVDKEHKKWQHTNGDSTQCPCYGFYIKCNRERILYVTDTKEVTYCFKNKNIETILVGVNYSNLFEETDNISHYQHKLTGHMSKKTCIEFILANLTNDLKNIVFCHLSNLFSDTEEMLAEVQKVVPWANVSVARAGLEIELAEKCPF